MNRHQLVTFAVAVACFAAVGTAATALGESLDSDPQDAVDPNYEMLPIERSDAVALNQQIQTNADDPSSAEASATAADSRGEEASGPGGATERTGAAASMENGMGTGVGSASSPGLGPNVGTGVLSVLDVLFWLAVLGTMAALAVRYRHWLFTLFDSLDAADPAAPDDGRLVPDSRRTENEVFAAWDAFVASLAADGHIDDPYTRTTRECAAAATAAGCDADAVATLRRSFEEIRYGDRPVTARHRERVTTACSRLGIDLPEGTR